VGFKCRGLWVNFETARMEVENALVVAGSHLRHSFTPRAKQVLEFHRAGFTDGAEPHKHRASAAGHSA